MLSIFIFAFLFQDTRVQRKNTWLHRSLPSDRDCSDVSRGPTPPWSLKTLAGQESTAQAPGGCPKARSAGSPEALLCSDADSLSPEV